MRIIVILNSAIISLLLSSQPSMAALSGYWSFDADFTNQQGNSAFDGTAVGTGTSITNSIFQVGGGALAIDNAPDATDFVDIAGNVLPSSSINTVVGWYRLEDISNDGSDARNFVWETAPSSWTLSFGVNGGTAQWFTKDPSLGGDLGTLPVVNLGQWHHAAVVIDENADTLSYYHDGSLWETVSIPGLTIERGAASSGFHIGNHRAGDGGRNWDGYIDEVAIFSQALTSNQISDLFNKTLTIPEIETTELTLTINRDTGQITISNDTGTAQGINGYSIRSADGALDEAAYTPLADGDSNWVQFTDPGATGDLSEGHLTTDTINDGETISLGNAWTKYIFEESDIKFKYLNAANETIDGLVQFTGTSNLEPFVAGDLDFDGSIDGGDWTAFLVGHGGDFAETSRAQSYGLGDLDGDFDNDMFDFLDFEAIYDSANGVGALKSLIASVPEPSTFFLALSIAVAMLVLGRTSRQSDILVPATADSHKQEGRGMTTTSKEFPTSLITRYLSIFCTFFALGMLSTEGRAELVAAWTFDDDFTASFGGINFDLTSVNGATAGDAGGKFGNAATFERLNSEYAATTGTVNVLTSGSDFSYSAWYNFGVADITGGDRYFVLETTAGTPPDNSEGWTASIGLRDLGAGDVVQVFTSPSTAVGTASSASNVWQNVIVTYDADGGTNSNGILNTYLDGSNVPFATLDDFGPVTPVNGLVIGGHRAGTGRNFEGQIDDVGFFDHVLTPAEISQLQSASVLAEAPATEELTLTVNRVSGEIVLSNSGSIPATFNSYQIDSASGSLDTAGWNSLSDQNIDMVDDGADPGETWDEGNSSSANRLIESFLLGNTELAPAASISLGNAYDESVDAQDLEFRFNTLASGPFSGLIVYDDDPPVIFGDFEPDGDVDIIDFGVFADAFGSTDGDGNYNPAADSEPDSDVDIIDFGKFADNFGIGTLQSAAVPEPSTVALLGICLAGVLFTARSRQQN